MFTPHLIIQLSRLLTNKVIQYVGLLQVDLVLKAQEKVHRLLLKLQQIKLEMLQKSLG